MSTIKDSEAVHLLDEAQLLQGNIENANEPESSKEAFIADMQRELGVPNNVSKSFDEVYDVTVKACGSKYVPFVSQVPPAECMFL